VGWPIIKLLQVVERSITENKDERARQKGFLLTRLHCKLESLLSYLCKPKQMKHLLSDPEKSRLQAEEDAVWYRTHVAIAPYSARDGMHAAWPRATVARAE
jgi:hypothetical protein